MQSGSYVVGTATHVPKVSRGAMRAPMPSPAQGAEAGAHRGTFIGVFEDALVGMMALVPQLVDATGLPVLAAGGIMDGRGIVAARALGAQTAMMGIAFLTTRENAIAEVWKTRVRGMSDTPTTVTRAITGRHARGIRNPLMQRLRESAESTAPYPVQNALTQAQRQSAARRSNRRD
ncbi:nitronate monooxygenase [Burkholderia sp. JPY481]